MTEGASMTGVRTEGTAGAMVLVLSKKRGEAASGIVAALIMVGLHSVTHACTVSKFASNIKAGLPCAGMLVVCLAPKVYSTEPSTAVCGHAQTLWQIVCSVLVLLQSWSCSSWLELSSLAAHRLYRVQCMSLEDVAVPLTFLATGRMFSISRLCSQDASYCASF